MALRPWLNGNVFLKKKKSVWRHPFRTRLMTSGSDAFIESISLFQCNGWCLRVQINCVNVVYTSALFLWDCWFSLDWWCSVTGHVCSVLLWVNIHKHVVKEGHSCIELLSPHQMKHFNIKYCLGLNAQNPQDVRKINTDYFWQHFPWTVCSNKLISKQSVFRGRCTWPFTRRVLRSMNASRWS